MTETTTQQTHAVLASTLRTPTVTRAEALAFIDGRNGRIFAIKFIKRTTGKVREMVCRQGVKSHLMGGSPAYDFASKGLIVVFDMQKVAYRSIGTESIINIEIDGEWHTVVGE